MTTIQEDRLARAIRLAKAIQTAKGQPIPAPTPQEASQDLPATPTPQATSAGLEPPPPGAGIPGPAPIPLPPSRGTPFVPHDPSLVVDRRTAQDPAMERFAVGFAQTAASGIVTIAKAIGFGIQKVPGIPDTAGQILIDRARVAQAEIERDRPSGFAGGAGEFLGIFANPVFIGSFVAAGKIAGRSITVIAGKLGARAEKAALAAGRTPEVARRIGSYLEAGTAGAGIGAVGLGTVGAIEGFAEEGSVIDAAGGAAIGSAEGLIFGAALGVSLRALLGGIAKVNPAVKRIIDTPMSEFASRKALDLTQFGRLTREQITSARNSGVTTTHSDLLGANRTPEAIRAADAVTARILKAAETLLERRQPTATKAPPAEPVVVEPQKVKTQPKLLSRDNAARKVVPSQFRRGIINLDLFSRPVEATIKAGKWSSDATIKAANWLFHAFDRAIPFKSARDALIKRFGESIKPFVTRIWSVFKGRSAKDIPKHVFETKFPLTKAEIEKLSGVIDSAKPVRKEFEELKREDIRRKVAGVHKTRGIRGATGLFAGRAQLRGAVERPAQDFEPLDLPQKTIDAAVDHVRHHTFFGKRVLEADNTAMALHDALVHGVLPTALQMERLEVVLGTGVVKSLLKKLPAGQRFKKNLLDVLNVSRAMKASIDLSAVARQGLWATIRHPIKGAQAFKSMIRALVNEEFAQDLEFRLKTRKWTDDVGREWDIAEIARDQGLELTTIGITEAGLRAKAETEGKADRSTDREEAFQSTLADRIPGIRMSNRAFVTYLNLMRASTFDNAAIRVISSSPLSLQGPRRQLGSMSLEQLQKLATEVGVAKGGTKLELMQRIRQSRDVDLSVLKPWGKLVNAMTGRANFRGFGDMQSIINATLFSPRFQLSRFEYHPRLVAQLRFNFSKDQSRRIVGKLAAQQLAADAAFMISLWAMWNVASDAFGWDAEVDMNPQSPTFMKLRLGEKITIDVSAGVGSAARYALLFATETQADPITGITFKRRRRDILTSLLRGKLSPPAGAVWSVAAGERFGGKELRFFPDRIPIVEGIPEDFGILGDLFVPISIEQFFESINEHGAQGTWLMIPETLGFGVNIYEPFPPPRRGTKKATGLKEAL